MSCSIYKKGLVVGIIILFVGVGIQPIFANEISISTTPDSKEDCGNCQVSDDYNPLRTKLSLFKVKAVTNILLSTRIGKLPEIKEDCQEILDVINSNNPILERPLCELLGAMQNQTGELIDYYEELLQNTEYGTPLYDFYFRMALLYLGIAIYYYVVGIMLLCWEGPQPGP